MKKSERLKEILEDVYTKAVNPNDAYNQILNLFDDSVPFCEKHPYSGTYISITGKQCCCDCLFGK